MGYPRMTNCLPINICSCTYADVCRRIRIQTYADVYGIRMQTYADVCIFFLTYATYVLPA